jgi:xanthosine utilization system XapX-like protein
MGTISRSWDLLGQSFAVLKSDKQLMWLPVISAIFCIAATVIIFSVGVLVVVPLNAIPHDPAGQKLLGQEMTPFVFLFYLVTYSIAIFFNVALVTIAADRINGGDATLNDGLQAAWARKWRIFQWAILAATVGILLNMLQQRLGLIGRLITSAIGFVWTLASFFVAPILAAEDMGPVEALYKSAQIFRDRWGEELVGGFSFGLIFFLLAIPGIIPPILGAKIFGVGGMFVGLGIAVIYWMLLGVVSSAAQGIFVAALYRYATTGEASGGFQLDQLSSAWHPKE